MSKKGGQGRATPGTGAGAATSSSGPGRGGTSTSKGSLSNGRNSHFKVVQSDAKYGMLLWQSKLQEKLLQEQKEKKRESARRKSDEDYQKALQQSRQGSYANTFAANTTTTVNRSGSGGEPRTISFYSSASNSNANANPAGREMRDLNTTRTRTTNTTTTTESEERFGYGDSDTAREAPGAGVERRIEILKDFGERESSSDHDHDQVPRPQGPGPGQGRSISRASNSQSQPQHYNHNPSSTSTGIGTPPAPVTTPTLVVTDADADVADANVDREIAAVLIPKDQHYLLNQNPNPNPNATRTQNQTQNQNQTTRDGVFTGAGRSGFDTTSRMQDYNYHNHNNGRSRNPNATVSVTAANTYTGRAGAGLSSNYQREKAEKAERPVPVLPKIVPKLNSSVSCDNLNLAKNATAVAQSQQMQMLGNLAFFGLNGGAGAPRRTPSGRMLTNLQGHPDIRYHQKDTRGFDQTLRYMMDKEKINQYKEDLDKQLEEKQRWRRQLGSPSPGSVGTIKIMSSHDQLDKRLQDDQSFYHAGESDSRRSSRNGVELAPLIRKYKSLPRLNALNSTDVTKSFVTSPRRSEYEYCLSPEPEEIAKGLSIQLAEKQRIQHIHKQNEKLAAERHFSTWDSWWGRPGHGAPMFYSRNSRIGASTPNLLTSRVNLFKAIHMTHQNQKKSK